MLAGLLDAHRRREEAAELFAEAASVLTAAGAFGLLRQLGLDEI